MPKLLAVSQIIQAPTSYGVALAPIANQPYFEKVAIRHQLDLSRVAAMADVDKDELLQLNPAFKQGITLDGPRHLLVPVAKADGLSESLARLQPDNLMQWQRYQVRRGDSLDSIAKRHGVASSTLRDLNQLPDRQVRTGQALLIPQLPGNAMQVERSAPVVAARAETTTKPALRRYRVRKGDTLWSVAKQHNVAVADLQRWSKLKGKSIHAGQVLTLHEDRPRVAAKAKSGGDTRQSVTYYKVRRGDSLSDIAQRFAVGTHHLKQWNPSLGRTLKPGQTLTLYLGRR
ncbi:Membrane-bound lytic murein transglycosylase D precursor [compost metagenome]